VVYVSGLKEILEQIINGNSLDIKDVGKKFYGKAFWKTMRRLV